ncbi:MAG: phosphate regulon transcriptional regulator PhoB [Paracoccaceae bacterium]
MSVSDPRVLVVEDEPSQVALLRYNLQAEGYEVLVATDGEAGVELARTELPDVILLDWMLPKLPGVEVCRQLRRNKSTREIPIIMLTARSEERDIVRGMDTGADDYITKPYSVKELLARVRAVLRRPAASIVVDHLHVGKISVDVDKHRVTVDGQDVHLGPTEYRLLTTLMQTPDRVYSRERLLDIVWGLSAELNTRTVDVHIGRLRKSLQKAGLPDSIRTVRGFGYSIQGD